jgi:hypothetical protein
MSFVVTGTPRSGTRYVSTLLTAIGLKCYHEKTLRPLATTLDVVRWPTLGIGESSWMAWCVVPLMVGHRVPVLQTIRDPWKVIDSLTNRNHILNPLVVGESALKSIRQLINVMLPNLFDREQRVDRSVELVLGWDRLIREYVPHRYVFHVDRLDVSTIGEMLTHIGAEATDDEITSALAEVSTSTNSGYTVEATMGISDPDVAKWIVRYAKEKDCGRISTCKIRDVPVTQSPEELAELMDPGLLEQLNHYAEHYGYPTYEMAACA